MGGAVGGPVGGAVGGGAAPGRWDPPQPERIPPRQIGGPPKGGIDVYQRPHSDPRGSLTPGQPYVADRSQTEEAATATLILGVVGWMCALAAPFALWQFTRTKAAAQYEGVEVPARALVGGVMALFSIGSFMLFCMGTMSASVLR